MSTPPAAPLSAFYDADRRAVDGEVRFLATQIIAPGNDAPAFGERTLAAELVAKRAAALVRTLVRRFAGVPVPNPRPVVHVASSAPGIGRSHSLERLLEESFPDEYCMPSTLPAGLRMAQHGDEALDRYERSKVICVDAEALLGASPAKLDEFMEVVLEGRIEGVHRKYREPRDVVLREDVAWILSVSGLAMDGALRTMEPLRQHLQHLQGRGIQVSEHRLDDPHDHGLDPRRGDG